MSDSLIAFQPRMLEPSKPRPSSKVPSSRFSEDGEVLPLAREVHEAQIDGLDFLLTGIKRKDFPRVMQPWG